MRRVSVVGTLGSGKSTFARELASRLNVPYVELDELNWGPRWTEASAEELRGRVKEKIAGDAWVIDGNYCRKIGSTVWARADTVVWLDLPWPLTFFRVLRRTIRRSLGRTELFNGNRETLREAFFSRESLLLFSIRSAQGRRRIGEQRLAQFGRPDLTVLRFHSQAEADRWLKSVGHEAASPDPAAEA